MFKSARWRSEKTKIKAVFRLQFQATQVPQLKATTLTISLVPADVGKPTVRLQKAAILEGACYWENPVYETMKLIRNQKTGRFEEKFYHFVVSSGSSKVGILGEVSINFADYADATKPSTVSLPIRTSNHGGTGAILHVTIDNVNRPANQRDVEAGESPTTKSQHRSLKNQQSNRDTDGNSNLSLFDEDEYINGLTSENAEYTGSFRRIPSENPIICQDEGSLRQVSVTQKRITDSFPGDRPMHRRSNTDWSLGSASNASTVDSTNSPEENLQRERLPKASDRSTEKLTSKISMLERQAEISELELQSLRKQIVKETKRGQDLSRQISKVKEERDALKTECEKLKSSFKGSDHAKVSDEMKMEAVNLNSMLEEIRRELNHEKDLKHTLRLRLQKTEDSNSELILAVRDLDEMLEQKNREIADLSALVRAGKNEKEASKEDPDYKDEAKEVSMLEQKIIDLHGEIKIYRKDREELTMHVEQLAVDQGTLKQKNHDISVMLEQKQKEHMKMQNECSENLTTIKEFKIQIERLEKETEKQTLDLFESADTIKKLETQVYTLEKEIEKQKQVFEDDLGRITHAKIEQEQRAIQAEEALRKAKSNSAIAADRIQEEFRRISAEMACKFDESEKMAMNAVREANELRRQKHSLEQMLQKANEELGLIKEHHKIELQELLDQIDMKSKQSEAMSQKLEEKWRLIENFKKQEAQMCKPFTSDNQKLSAKIEKVKMQNLFCEVRCESNDKHQVKRSSCEQEIMHSWRKEREDLKRELASARREAQLLQAESNTLRPLKDEKEIMVKTLQSDIENLKNHNNVLKQCLSEVEMDKEKLKKEVFRLESNLQIKEGAADITEKKRQTNTEQATSRDTEQMTFKDNKSAPLSCDLFKEEVAEKSNSLEEARATEELTANASELNIQLTVMNSTAGTFKQVEVGASVDKSEVETCTVKEPSESTFLMSDDCHLTQMLNEMALLKERNRYMEEELKDMQERYSKISLKFAEVEGERQQLVMTVRNLKKN